MLIYNIGILIAGIGLALKILEWVVLVILGLFIFVQTIVRLEKHFIHIPCPTFVPYLINNPVRRKFLPPEGVIDHVDIQEGMKVLELGPGTGFCIFEAARRAGSSGHVYGIDIKSKLIAKIKKEIEQRGVTNITAQVSSAYEIPLPNNSVDRAFMVGVLPEIPDRQKALREIRRVLKKDGLLVLAEWLIDPDYPRRKTEIGWCRDAGFELVGTYGNAFFYVLTFKLAGGDVSCEDGRNSLTI